MAADIIAGAIKTMGGSYEVRGNDGVFLESGKRKFDEHRAHIYLGNIDRNLPRLIRAVKELERAYSQD